MNASAYRSAVIGCLFIISMMVIGEENAAARGAGIAAGEGRLHPSIEVDLAYDTNPGYFPDGHADKKGDMILRLHPGISIEYPSEMISVDFTGTVGYDWYFGIGSEKSRDLSSIVANGDLKFGINPKGQISFFIEDLLSRSGDPRYTSLTQKLNRTDNEAKVHFQIKPGGQALTFDLAYGFFFDLFDDYKEYSSYAHRIYFSGKWKFLPKTALIVDFDADIRRYVDAAYPTVPNSSYSGLRNIDINGVRAYVGLLGQITPMLSIMFKAGYGDTVLNKPASYTGSDYRSAIGQAEIDFRMGTTFLKGGYLRNFQPVMFFAYYGQDRVYIRFIQQIAGKFSIDANIGFDFLAYGKNILPENNQGKRSDKFLAGNLILGYNIIDWLKVGLRYDFQALFSDYKQMDSSQTGVEYNKHVFTLFVNVDY
jgi:hypothetical protein